MRVLIVDDNKDLGLMLEQLIRKFGGYDTCVPETPQEALKMYQPGDVVLFDLNMPLMSGLSFITNLMNQDPSVKCIVMTGACHSPLLDKMKVMGVADFVLKPCPIGIMIKKIKRLVEVGDV